MDRALSPEGKSFSYDVKGSGFGRGEGGACVLLKRLDDAIEAGDPIHAIIRNSACNHGGRSDGITMPRRSAQETLLRRVHREVGLNLNETPVVEVSLTRARLLAYKLTYPRATELARKSGKSFLSMITLVRLTM